MKTVKNIQPFEKLLCVLTNNYLLSVYYMIFSHLTTLNVNI